MTESHSDVVLLGGSPSAHSRSSALLASIAGELERAGLRTKQWHITDFPAEDLLFARSEQPRIAEYLRSVAHARALILGTPVYKAIYSGALKVALDLIPPDGLAGKTVLGVATARAEAHGPTVSSAFTELFKFFKDSAPLPTLFLLDGQVVLDGDKLELGPSAQTATADTVAQLRKALGVG